MSQQKLFALLVGIDNYHPKSYKVSNLKGCVNDITATERLLSINYREMQPRIKKLTNERATYDHIIQQFENHLIKNAGPQTTLLFWFSGHGSRQDTDPAFAEYSPEKKDETLVCYDSRAQMNGQLPYHDLADKELAVLIDLAAQKGAEVVTVFDCCHSGSITREEDEEQEQTRMVGDRSLAQKAVSSGYLRGYYQKNKLIEVPEGRHIALMACQKNETAKEIKLDGKRRGVFSYHLQETLKRNPGITYAQLFNQVKSRIDHYQFNSLQTPQFDAVNLFDVTCSFLTRQQVKYPKQRYEIYYSQKYQAWKIRLGAAQGLPQPFDKVIFAIYKEPTKGEKPLGYVQVSSAGMAQSFLLTNRIKLNVNENYWGEVASIPQVPVHLNLKGDTQAKQRLQKQMKYKPWRFFDFENESIFTLDIARKGWQLTKDGKDLFKKPQSLAYGEMVNKLDQLGKWHLLLKNKNAATYFKPSDFQFTIKNLHLDKKITLEHTYQREEFYCYPDQSQTQEKKWSTPYQIFAQNNTYQELYFILLYFTPGYGIKVYYNQPVPARSTEAILLNKARMNPRENDLVVNYFQLLVSTAKIDSQFFIQPDIVESPYRYVEEDEEGIEDWCTLTLELALQKA